MSAAGGSNLLSLRRMRSVVLIMAVGYAIRRGLESVTAVASFGNAVDGPSFPSLLSSRGITLLRISNIHKPSGTTHCLLTSSTIGLGG